MSRIRKLGCLVVVGILVLMAGSGELRAQQGSERLLTKQNFRISFDGIPALNVIQVKGLVSETVVEVSKDRKVNARKMLEPVRLVVVRRVQAPDRLWQWRSRIAAGKKDRRNGRIDLLSRDGRPLVSYILTKAWPYKWVWPELDVSDPTPAMEEIHFLVEKITPVAGKGKP